MENEDVDLGENDEIEEDFDLESDEDDTDIEEGFDKEELSESNQDGNIFGFFFWEGVKSSVLSM